MLNTDNFGLRLPIRGVDRANVDDINYNSEVIDRVMGDNGNLVAPMFDPNRSQPYHEGDMVRQETLSGHISTYICIVPEASLTWDPSEWDVTNAAEQIHAAKESGGTEVEANPSGTPTDTLTSIGIAGSIYAVDGGSDVTKTATGNPIELTDGADAPLVKCVTEITGSQDLHGYDKPWVGGAGKNKIPVLLSEVKSNNTDGTWNGDTYSYSGVTFKVDSNSEGYVTKITVNASPSSSAFSFYLRRTATVYTDNMILNGCPSGGGDSTYDLRVSGGYRDTGSGATIPANTSFSDFWIVIRSGITVSNLVFQPMIRLASVTDPTFERYENICPITAYTEGEIEVSDGDENTTTHTTTYPSAIYRGSEDVVNGTATHDRKYIDSNITSITRGSLDSSGLLYRVYNNSDIKTDSNQNPIFLICNKYDVVDLGRCREKASNGEKSCCSYGSTIYIGGYVGSENDLDTELLTIQFAYETEPSTSSVTPTNLPIKSLSGYNHIESTTGEMEIEYITQAQQPLIDLIRAEKGDTYSTSEQIVGKWIDESTLYRRTYEITVQSPSAPYTEDISISGLVVVGIEKHYANYQYSGTWYYESGDQLNGAYLSITQKDETGTALTVSSNMGSGLDAIKLCFSVSYIKTASNNRSLAKGAEEPKEEPVKEPVKEPEEKPEEKTEEKPEEKKAEEEKADETETENSER